MLPSNRRYARLSDRHLRHGAFGIGNGIVRELSRVRRPGEIACPTSYTRCSLRTILRAPLCRLSRRSQKPPRLAGTPAKAWETMTAMAEATLPDLIATGFVKAPLELERTYKGVRLTASVQPDGTVLCGGETCETLSAAGGVARKSVLATPPSDPPPETNGWIFWQFRDPKTGNLRDMDGLRQEFLAQKK